MNALFGRAYLYRHIEGAPLICATVYLDVSERRSSETRTARSKARARELHTKPLLRPSQSLVGVESLSYLLLFG